MVYRPTGSDSQFEFRSGGLFHLGASFSSVTSVARELGLGTVLSWNDIKPAHLPSVSAADIHTEMRRCFDWDDIVRRTARAVFRYDGSQIKAIDEVTALALSDEWPAAIQNGTAYVDYCRRRNLPASCMSLGGLLGLLADALRCRWTSGPGLIREVLAADLRWARLVMLASAEPSIAFPRVEASASGYMTQRAILPAARLSASDHVMPFLVRTVELYSEFLPTVFARGAGAFAAQFGRLPSDNPT